MAKHTVYSASATYEFYNQPPRTIRLEIVAATAAKAASRAAQAARKEFRGSRPSSIVVVLEVHEQVPIVGRSKTKAA